MDLLVPEAYQAPLLVLVSHRVVEVLMNQRWCHNCNTMVQYITVINKVKEMRLQFMMAAT